MPSISAFSSPSRTAARIRASRSQVLRRQSSQHPEVEEGDLAVRAQQVVAGMRIAEGEAELARRWRRRSGRRSRRSGRGPRRRCSATSSKPIPSTQSVTSTRRRLCCGVDAGHGDERVVAPEARELPVVGGLELVVAFLDDPLAQLVEHVADVEPGHQPRRTGESMRRLRMSDSTASAMPGYWTLTATSRPLVRRRLVDLADAGRRGRLGVDLGRGTPRAPRPSPRLEQRASASRRRLGRCREARRAGSEVGGLIGVEAGELDRRENLPRLHRRAAHHRELIDERVDRGDDAVAAPPPLLFLGAPGVEAVARPSERRRRRRPCRGGRCGRCGRGRARLIPDRSPG